MIGCWHAPQPREVVGACEGDHVLASGEEGAERADSRRDHLGRRLVDAALVCVAAPTRQEASSHGSLAGRERGVGRMGRTEPDRARRHRPRSPGAWHGASAAQRHPQVHEGEHREWQQARRPPRKPREPRVDAGTEGQEEDGEQQRGDRDLCEQSVAAEEGAEHLHLALVPVLPRVAHLWIGWALGGGLGVGGARGSEGRRTKKSTTTEFTESS